ncbi:MAG: hypothetical protein ACRYGL_13645 [Janthinobacterium lividum]
MLKETKLNSYIKKSIIENLRALAMFPAACHAARGSLAGIAALMPCSAA